MPDSYNPAAAAAASGAVLTDTHADSHHAENPALLNHFDTVEQQRSASGLGMWVFLAQEVMFFGGMFCAYLIYRLKYFDAFVAGSNTLDIKLGTINTAVLICSSLTMALAVLSAQLGRRKLLVGFLMMTMALGAVFLGVKGVEYKQKFDDHHIPGPGFSTVEFEQKDHLPRDVANQAQIYYSLYFAMTGMHALHMIVGMVIMTFLVVYAWKGRYPPEHYTTIDNFGLYWHFVDIVWIFLFPLLYLISRHH